MGPSSYSKAQGFPVKILGLLTTDGVLHYHLLAQGENMNRYTYAWLIEKKFPEWRGNAEYVIQDYERCLRSAEPLLAFKEINMKVVNEHPPHSQDLNAIENAWKVLKDRLNDTMPSHLETRAQFIVRLRTAAHWINEHQRDQLKYFANNLKERAQAVKDNDGGRTKW